MSESFAELFEESIKGAQIRPGALVQGQVLEIGDDFVLINAGLKSESFIPIEQFKDEGGELSIKVGDLVELALESLEDGSGETRLSRERALKLKAWETIEDAFHNEQRIKGLVREKVKGGYIVQLDSLMAFLPGSLVDVRPVRDNVNLEGKELELKIIKMDQKRNNIVVSRRAVVEEETGADRAALLDTLDEGQIVQGVVKNLTDYGAFLDLGGIDGLLHITDMAWKRVKHPSEVVTIGDELTVKILKFDRERQRVSLGLKQLGDDPWIGIARRYPKDTRLFGKVSNITDYGCFVQLEDGVEGLVHVSEMDWSSKNANPNKYVTIGQEVEVMILDIDEDRRRISLGMKQCRENPWEAYARLNNKGDRVSGKIKSITDFGVFVGLEGGIDGLVHLTDLSWNEPGEQAVRRYRKGDDVEAVILAIDPDRERISLGVKQLAEDPWSDFVNVNAKGAVVKGVVKEVDAKGAVIELADQVTGYLRASDLSRDRVEDARTVLNLGDEVEAKLVGVDRKSRSLTLSLKAREIEEEQDAMANLNREVAQAPTLGDLIKEKMGAR